MARGVDQVELVLLAAAGAIVHAHRLRLDRDPLLALQLHLVQQLILHLARIHGAGELEHAIRQRRLAMVDVRDDGEISDAGLVHNLIVAALSAGAQQSGSGPSPTRHGSCGR